MASLNDLIKQFRFYFTIRGIQPPIELPNSPTGWRSLIIQYSRSKTYSGLLRNISGQLDFAEKAAYLLRREYAKYRLLARVLFTINMDIRQPYNNYQNIYTGKIDFTQKQDNVASFTVGATNSDFSTNIDAYDSTPYAISLDDGVNLQLPGIALNEIANLFPGIPPDGFFHSDYFPPVDVINNTQNSVAPSVQNVIYGQFRAPDFSTAKNWIFNCQKTGKLYITANLTYIVSAFGGGHHLKLGLIDNTGTTVLSFYDDTPPNGATTHSITVNKVLDVTIGQKLFLYMQQVDAETIDTGIIIQSGEIDFSYQTITPPTMCRAITGSQLFGKLLQAMNINQDSGPNLPIPYQSYLLAGKLANVLYTCSDSIRAAQGSIFVAGNTIGPGIYQVIQGNITYGAIVYALNQTFGFISTLTTFTGTGTVQKIQSVFVGNVYNVGDTLQAGGTYLVEGITVGGYVTYNGINYAAGTFFKYVLGFDTFTGSDDTMFVKQVAVDPVIITSFVDFFQDVKSTNSGDVAFGVDPYTALDSSAPELLHQSQGTPFIENLGYVYRNSVASDLGVLSKAANTTAATDMMYNTIKVGQEDQQYDAINGAQEVSSTQYYTSPLLAPVAELNLVTPYHRDPYGIESVRITQNDTAASRSDNYTFVIWANLTPITMGSFVYYTPLGSEGLSQPIVGVDPSYYNYELSPKHCLLRSPGYLASIFSNMTGYQLRLTGYLKNVGMVTVGLDGVKVSESAPVDLGSLGVGYFVPEIINDTVSCSLNSMPYSPVAFTLNGVKQKGFIIDYKANLALNSPQQIKLLAGPDYNFAGTVR